MSFLVTFVALCIFVMTLSAFMLLPAAFAFAVEEIGHNELNCSILLALFMLWLSLPARLLGASLLMCGLARLAGLGRSVCITRSFVLLAHDLEFDDASFDRLIVGRAQLEEFFAYLLVSEPT